MLPRLLVLVVGLAGATSGALAADEGTARGLVRTGSSAMPAWTPGGMQILFHSRRKESKSGSLPTRNVWIVNADGSGEKRLTSGTKDEYHASLAPDGKKMVFVSELNGSRDIWIADADGQNAVPLTDDPGTEDDPAWSPDSRQIAYAAFPKEGGNFDLWLVNSDGSGRRRLTTTAANELVPTWHPGGGQLAYVTDASGNFDIYTIDVHDGRTTPLVVTSDHEVRPAWSPDGSKIAFARWPARGRSTDSTLWVANADGTAPIELTGAPAPATHPAWSPDGRRLAFQHRAQTGWEIWELDLPLDIVQVGRLRLAQQIRSGADVDTAQLKNGDTLRGTVREASFRLRAPYGAIDLARTVVASILLDERGLARVVLTNGDALSGLLETDEIHLAAGTRADTIAVARLSQLSLRAGGRTATPPASFRAVMRNGDSLSLTNALGPLKLKVGGTVMEAEPARIDHVDFTEAGDRAQVVLTSSDSLSGELTGGRFEATLTAGPRLVLDPGSVRTLVRLGSKR